jgi:hypothetical protein
MPSVEKLLVATAFLEVGAGLGLLALPALVVMLLLGVRGPAPETLVVARVAGAGLLAIALACWLARDDRGSRSQQGLVWAILVYNGGTCVVLTLAGVLQERDGVALWPVVLVHAVMTVWCAATARAPIPHAR